MRNHERIDEFCNELATLWRLVPDWRFGQLIHNMFNRYEGTCNKDVFYVEDDDMICFVKELIQEVKHQEQ